MITPRDTDVETAELPANSLDPWRRPRSTRVASQRRAMQAAMAAAVRAMRTPGARATTERTPHAPGRPPTEA